MDNIGMERYMCAKYRMVMLWPPCTNCPVLVESLMWHGLAEASLLQETLGIFTYGLWRERKTRSVYSFLNTTTLYPPCLYVQRVQNLSPRDLGMEVSKSGMPSRTSRREHSVGMMDGLFLCCGVLHRLFPPAMTAECVCGPPRIASPALRMCRPWV
eukprot:Rmarinus@m.492